MLLLLNLPMIRVWIKILEIPRPARYSGAIVARLGGRERPLAGRLAFAETTR